MQLTIFPFSFKYFVVLLLPNPHVKLIYTYWVVVKESVECIASIKQGVWAANTQKTQTP